MSDKPLAVDGYVIETLMADLVGHDHRPSAFLVYLAILAAAGERRAALSYGDLAERTGLSKRTAQTAVAALVRRSLIEVVRRGPTETPEYRPLSPWRR
jgi:DNA-binding MarR family transcriptional regulator